VRCSTPSRGRPRPTQADLAGIAERVAVRVTRWLRRRGLLLDESSDVPPPERTALDACLERSLGLGELVALPGAVADRAGDDLLPRPSKSARRGGHACGFDVHAGVVVGARDREGRERLLRYCARPPLSLERLSTTPRGLVAYRVRKPWQPERTHRVMTPLAFMARLAALIPPPRHPLIRFHGVFAPHSSWRSAVVPDRPAPTTSPCPESPTGDGSSACQPKAEARAPEVHAYRTYIDWATLLRRIYDVDALRCPCGGRLRFIAVVTEAETAREILASMGLSCDASPIARARAPDLDFVEPLPDWE
jgi:hypothetical protein